MKLSTRLLLLIVGFLPAFIGAQTIELTNATCFGVDVTYALDGANSPDASGRNVYVDNAPPAMNTQTSIAYNTGAGQWEIIGGGQVFYTAVSTFSPNPPDSGTTPWNAEATTCGAASTATVMGSGTQNMGGSDPCAALNGDDDNDGVCNDNDICPGFDDNDDMDSDNIPDGCDPNPNTPDGFLVDSDCLDPNNAILLTADGDDGNGRNVYRNTTLQLEVVWEAANSQWEVRAIGNPTNIFFTNSLASIPNPPSSTAMGWTADNACTGQMATVSGSGTQDMRCVAVCDDNDPCTDDVLDDDCVCQSTPVLEAPTVADLTVCDGDATLIEPGGSRMTLLTEDFQDTQTYTTFGTVFNDGLSDHFGPTDGADIANVTGPYSFQGGGNIFIAAEDTDDMGSAEKRVTTATVDITGMTNLEVCIDVAAGNENGLGSGAYDAADFLQFQFNTDIEPLFRDALNFSYFDNGDAFNEPLYSDPNRDGDGSDGVQITTTAEQFCYLIPNQFTSDVSATMMSLRVILSMNGGGEEVAFDNLSLSGEPATMAQFNFYDSDPALGGATLLAGPAASYDPATTTATSPQSVFVTETNGTCESPATEVTVTVNELPTVTFTALADVCADAGAQSGQGGGTPTGGVYSGDGVTDDGDGMTYSFDPMAAGVGTTTITYTYTDPATGCENTATDDVEVFALPTVTFEPSPTDFCVTDADGQTVGGGLPVGGVYSSTDATIVDDGNGMTFTFNPATEGVGDYDITYTYTDANGCEASATSFVTVNPQADPPTVSSFTVCEGEATTITPATTTGTPTVFWTESFDEEDAGVTGACTSSNPADCSTNNPPANGQWSVSGNVAGLVATSDFFQVQGGQLTGQDLDAEVCFLSTPIDISGFTDIDFSVEISEDGDHEVADYADVSLIVDGTSTLITDWMGLGSATHTLVGDAPDDDDWESTTVEATGLNGMSLQVEICLFNGAGSERINIDDVQLEGTPVPDQFNFYDADPFAGPANLLAGPAASYDPGTTTATSPQSVFVTTASSPCESAAAEVVVTVEAAPAITCPAELTINLDASGMGAINFDTLSFMTATSNCTPTDTTTVGLQTYNCMSDASTSITQAITVTFAGGETSSCDVTVNVVDGMNPMLDCQADSTVYLDANGEFAFDPMGMINSATDNCAVTDTVAPAVVLDCDDLATTVSNYSGSISISDAAGNGAICIYSVNVLDTISPTVTCLDIEVQLDENGLGSYAELSLFEAEDNCEVNFMPFDQVFLVDCSDIGTPISYNIQVSDLSGNQSTSCMATITVLDTLGPVIMPANDTTLFLDVNGLATLSVMDYEYAIVGDNCGTATVTDLFRLDQNAQNVGADAGAEDASKSLDQVLSFTCDDIGNINLEVEIVFMDGNGNMTKDTIIVTILDTIPPELICQDVEVFVDAAGMASAEIDDIVVSETDNCTMDPIGAFFVPNSGANMFSCDDVDSSLERRLEIGDMSGNRDTCTFNITVRDTIAPVISCVSDTVYLDAAGFVSFAPGDRVTIEQDNCPPDVMVGNSPAIFGCDEVGENEFTQTRTDQFGNESEPCTFTVTILDTIAPVITVTPADVTLDLDGNASLMIDDLAAATDACGVASVVADRLDFGCDDIGTVDVLITATDVNGNVSTAIVTVDVDFEQPNLSCIGEINITLNDDCGAMLIPEMLLTGNTACLDAFNFDITVNDADPSNGPIIDGCGRFSYSITSPDRPETVQNGFRGDFIEDNWAIQGLNQDGTPLAGGDVAETDFSANTLTMTTMAGANNGGRFLANAIYTFSEDGTVAFDYDFNGVDPGFDVSFILTDFAGITVDEVLFQEDQPANGTATLEVEPGFRLILAVNDDGFLPLAPNTDIPSILTITNFSFTQTALLGLDFETCWGFVNAEDKTPPALVATPDDVELLCVDLDDNNISTLTADVSKCYEVFSATGLTVPGTMDIRLRNRLRAGGNVPLVPTFTDGCTERIRVCVSDVVTFDSNDPQCEDVNLTRTFTATEIATCANAAGEENESVIATYDIDFVRPSLDDLDDSNIDAVVEYEQCGNTVGLSFAEIRAQYPDPRPGDFPFLSVGGRNFPLMIGQSVCNIGVTYEDGNPTVTCANTFKFIRTYTVIDWCDPSDVREFIQVVKVGDTTAPTFFGPTQDRDFDGVVDGDLIYTTNAGNECAAFIRLDAAGVRAEDACSTPTITASIYPGGDLNATPIGSFDVDPDDGNAEVTTAIPVGCHLLRYTSTDACGNVEVSDFDFCVEDGTAPVAICEDGLNIGITSGSANDGTPTGIAVLTPDMLDKGSYDDCSGITLAIARVNAANIATEAYDQELILTCADLGIVRVGLRVTDALGNENFCWLDVLVEDKVAPTCIPPGPVRISCIEYNETLPADITESTVDERNAVFGSAAGIDNCEVTITETISGDVNSCGVGSFTRVFTATDGQGFTNTAPCRQRITVFGIHDYQLIFPTDEEAGCATIPDYDEIAANELACDLITTTVDVDTLRTLEAGEECFKLRVTYDVINWCEYGTLGQPYLIPRDGDGIRNPETQLLYLNVVPVDVNTTTDDFAFLSRFSDRNYNPGPPQRDQLLDDGDDMDGTDDDNGNDNIDDDAYAADASRGHFRYIQFIKVYDEVAPTIVADQPADCFGGSGENCEANVTLTFTAEDECSNINPGLELDANYVAANGFNADNAAALGIGGLTAIDNGDGKYQINLTGVPVGNHAIRIRANDGCGNFDVEILEFCVTGDKAPTPICIGQLTVTLMPDGNGGGMAEIWASDFIASDVEDCFGNVIDDYSIYTEEEANANGFSPQAGRLGIDFDCESDATIPVRVYAIDQQGSADYCSVIVLVQLNNPDMCEQQRGILSGTITTATTSPLGEVAVTLTGDNDMDETMETDANGVFLFSGLELGVDYTLQPAYSPEVDLGHVRTSDVVMISTIILGAGDFDSPYDYLAADVNQDKVINILDIIGIQRVILGLDETFQTGETWGFVRADVDVEEPILGTFPNVYNINNFEQNVLGADFVAWEYGNVIGEGRSSATLEVEDRELETGEVHTIRLNSGDLLGFQGTLELGAGLELLNVDYTGEGGLNLNRVGEGLIAVSLRGAVEISLEVRATEAGQLSDLLRLTDVITPREGVLANGSSGALNLAFVTSSAPAAAPNVLHQNTPNPVSGETVIRYELAVAGPAVLRVQDAAGRLVMTRKLDAISGANSVRLTAAELGASGVLTYTLTSGDFTATRKMVVVR